MPSIDSKSGHSEVYLGRYRDFWWNQDFVELNARRLRLKKRRRVLEVGSGAGHWVRTYSRYLAKGAQIECVDRDPKWAESNQPWIDELRRNGVHLRVRAGDAYVLPFADKTFDFVTCQTLLLHLQEPGLAIAEMVRVLKPGGLLLCVEPDNFAIWAASENSLSRKEGLEEDVDAFRYKAAQARGRIARGLGNSSIGGRVPGMFAVAGLTGIEVRLSDRTVALFPPYASPAQVAFLVEIRKWFEAAPEFDRQEVMKNYLAGGGAKMDFDRLWTQDLAQRERFLADVQAGRFDQAGGSLVYLVSGNKAPDLGP